MRPTSQCDALPILAWVPRTIFYPEQVPLGRFRCQLSPRCRRGECWILLAFSGRLSDRLVTRAVLAIGRLCQSPRFPSADSVQPRPPSLSPSSHRFGAYPSPCGTRSSAATRLCGFRSFPQQVRSKTGEERRANFIRLPPKKQTFTLGSRPTPVALPYVTRAIREFKTENRNVSEQNHSNRLSRKRC
jgi:hypothetical protein